MSALHLKFDVDGRFPVTRVQRKAELRVGGSDMSERMIQQAAPIAERRTFGAASGGAVVSLITTDEGGWEVSVDKGFVARLEQACDLHPEVPDMNKGRLTWLQAQLKQRHGLDLSVETLSRYFKGIMRPRHAKMAALAELLEVDEAWLALGMEPDYNLREQRKRVLLAEGAANVLAGLIAMAGGAPAEPPAGRPGRKVRVDLSAVIQRAHYEIHVTLAKQGENGTTIFSVPAVDEGVFVVGAIPTPDPFVYFVEIPHELALERGKMRGGVIDLALTAEEIERLRIKDFGVRF